MGIDARSNTSSTDPRDNAGAIEISSARDTYIDGTVVGGNLYSGKHVEITGGTFSNSRVKINMGDRSYEGPTLIVATALIIALGVSVFVLIFSGSILDKAMGGAKADVSVTGIPGAEGAKKTFAELKKAELAGDAEGWCAIAQPTVADCRAKISRGWADAAPSYRDEIKKVEIVTVTVTDGTATGKPTIDGKPARPFLLLMWSRNRWLVPPGDYSVSVGVGGYFYFLIDVAHGKSPWDILLRGMGG